MTKKEKFLYHATLIIPTLFYLKILDEMDVSPGRSFAYGFVFFMMLQILLDALFKEKFTRAKSILLLVFLLIHITIMIKIFH